MRTPTQKTGREPQLGGNRRQIDPPMTFQVVRETARRELRAYLDAAPEPFEEPIQRVIARIAVYAIPSKYPDQIALFANDPTLWHKRVEHAGNRSLMTLIHDTMYNDLKDMLEDEFHLWRVERDHGESLAQFRRAKVYRVRPRTFSNWHEDRYTAKCPECGYRVPVHILRRQATPGNRAEITIAFDRNYGRHDRVCQCYAMIEIEEGWLENIPYAPIESRPYRADDPRSMNF